MKCVKFLLLAAVISIFVFPSVHANDIDDINNMVKKKVSTIVALLSQNDADVDTRNKKIVAELNEIIDFKLTAYLSLGKNWKKINKKNKKIFTKIFKQYINNYIVDKIGLYDNQGIEIGDVKTTKKGRAELEMAFQSGDEKFIVAFKLRKNKKKKWLVYDLDVEGVSVITTLRSQFDGVLKKDSFDTLLEKLKQPLNKS